MTDTPQSSLGDLWNDPLPGSRRSNTLWLLQPAKGEEWRSKGSWFLNSSLLSKNVIIEKRLPHITLLLDGINLPYYSRPKVTFA